MQELQVAKVRALGHAAGRSALELGVPFQASGPVAIVVPAVVEEEERRVIVPDEAADVFPLLGAEVVVCGALR